MRRRSISRLSTVCALAAALISCGDSTEVVKPTPRSEFRSTYPCQLLTKAMAREILSIQALRRTGAQTLSPGGLEQCTWSRGRYKSIPHVQLTISPTTNVYGTRSVATMQRIYEQKRLPGYRALKQLGDHAYLVATGRPYSEILVAQDGRSFALTLRLKQKPRSQPPPLAALEALARDISARYTRPPG